MTKPEREPSISQSMLAFRSILIPKTNKAALITNYKQNYKRILSGRKHLEVVFIFLCTNSFAKHV